MHENELAAATDVIKNTLQTDSYLIGNVEENDIEKLRNQGLILKVLDEERKIPKTPGNTDIRTLSETVKLNVKFDGFLNISDFSSDLELLENFNPGFPAYYKIVLETPLIDQYRFAIESLGVSFQQYLGNDSYIVLLNEGDAEKLRALDFVRLIQYYTQYDTGINILINAVDNQLETSIISSPFTAFDLLLHRKEDKQPLINWLEERGIKILGSSFYKVRIEANVKKDRLEEIAANKLVQSVEEYISPELLNDLSRQILQIDNTGIQAWQFDYEGEGEVVGIADTGIDDTHPDLQDRILGKIAIGRPPYDSSDPAGHGTHVAGSIVGTGAASGGLIKGTAPKAKIFFQSILKSDGRLNIPVDLGTLFQDAYNNGARIHNNSWGAATKSRYTANSAEVDGFVYDNKDMLIVFSAGNDGKGLKNRNAPVGYTDLLSLGSPATAKNALTVGASRGKRSKGGYTKLTYGKVWQDSFPDNPTNGEKISGNTESLAAFSSRGPVDDERRIKPDIVAPGTDIASTFSKDAELSDFCGIHPSYDEYAIMCGTSMSAPLVSGCAALAREYYLKKHIHKPSAALLKATLINCGRLLSGNDANGILLRDHSGTVSTSNVPHFHQGFGLLDMLKCIPGTNADFKLDFRDTYLDPAFQVNSNGQKFRFNLKITTLSWVRICLVYTDPPGRGLQHNLILLADLVSQGKKWAGNSFLPKNLQIIDPQTNLEIDLHNNVQAIHINDGAPGLYSIQVIAHNVWKFPQDFALVVTSGDLNFSFLNY
jgi:serine protease AprX